MRDSVCAITRRHGRRPRLIEKDPSTSEASDSTPRKVYHQVLKERRRETAERPRDNEAEDGETQLVSLQGRSLSLCLSLSPSSCLSL